MAMPKVTPATGQRCTTRTRFRGRLHVIIWTPDGDRLETRSLRNLQAETWRARVRAVCKQLLALTDENEAVEIAKAKGW